MRLSAARRGTVFALAAIVFATIWPLSAQSITKAEVERACADSKAQYEAYEQARADFDAAVEEWEDTRFELSVVEQKQTRANSVATVQVGSVEEVRQQLEAQAIELYMQGGFGTPDLMLVADSVDDLITGEVFLAASSGEDLASLDQLISLQADLGRYQGDLDTTETELENLEAAQAAANDRLEAAAAAERDAASRLDARCAELNKQYEAEQAAKRAAEEEARRRAAAQAARAASSSSASSGGSSAPSRISVVSGLACPFPGSAFRDTWGAPRSGGRRHKGVDMFGAWNAGIYAVDNGTVYIRNGGLGGKTVWLVSPSGAAYYYAHLSGWNVSNGQRVGKGDLIGYNGDTGNARGGTPHLHFEVHPGGRGSAAINPTPTVRASC